MILVWNILVGVEPRVEEKKKKRVPHSYLYVQASMHIKARGRKVFSGFHIIQVRTYIRHFVQLPGRRRTLPSKIST